MFFYPPTGRLDPLRRQLKAGVGECPFVVREAPGERIDVQHFDGGRDATYVQVVLQDQDPDRPSKGTTIRYAPHVAGTALVYDATAGRMQGKARPFECEWDPHRAHLFAILPVQIESIEARLERVADRWRLHVAFLDALGETIQAALPYQLSLGGNDFGNQFLFGSTSREDGRTMAKLPGIAPQPGQKCGVSSLLTGFGVTLDFPDR
jgi:hypothetical protein